MFLNKKVFNKIFEIPWIDHANKLTHKHRKLIPIPTFSFPIFPFGFFSFSSLLFPFNFAFGLTAAVLPSILSLLPNCGSADTMLTALTCKPEEISNHFTFQGLV